jgi:hypothetical protein
MSKHYRCLNQYIFKKKNTASNFLLKQWITSLSVLQYSHLFNNIQGSLIGLSVPSYKESYPTASSLWRQLEAGFLLPSWQWSQNTWRLKYLGHTNILLKNKELMSSTWIKNTYVTKTTWLPIVCLRIQKYRKQLYVSVVIDCLNLRNEIYLRTCSRFNTQLTFFQPNICPYLYAAQLTYFVRCYHTIISRSIWYCQCQNAIFEGPEQMALRHLMN